MTVNAPVALWDRLVDEFVKNDRESSAESDFFQPGVDRVALVRNALSRPGGNSRAVAVTLLKRMNREEQKVLFPQLVQLAHAAHGPVGAVREIIQSLPREWVLTHIDAEVERILEKEEYDDYWMFLELYAALDAERALKLARRAANHPDPNIRELGLHGLPRA